MIWFNMNNQLFKSKVVNTYSLFPPVCLSMSVKIFVSVSVVYLRICYQQFFDILYAVATRFGKSNRTHSQCHKMSQNVLPYFDCFILRIVSMIFLRLYRSMGTISNYDAVTLVNSLKKNLNISCKSSISTLSWPENFIGLILGKEYWHNVRTLEVIRSENIYILEKLLLVPI